MTTTRTTRTVVTAGIAAALIGGGVAAGATAGTSSGVPRAASRAPAANTVARHRHGQQPGRHGMRHGSRGPARAHDPATGVSALPVTALSEAERTTLTSMAEEEKLAHDVYVKLAAVTGLPSFGRIAASETRHGDAIGVLLDRHAIPDPTDGKAVGSFADAAVQATYDRLIADGARSTEAALRVGAFIEERDIADLQHAIAETDARDLDLVYGRLLEGSKHHLRAYVRQLSQRGVTYAPQVLTARQLQAYTR